MDSPKFTVKVEMLDGVLEVYYSGETDPAHAEAVDRRIAEAAAANGTMFVLMDMRQLKGRMNPTQSYELARSTPPQSHLFFIAFVDLPENMELMDHFVTTATNAGRPSKAFMDIGEARKWLQDLLKKRTPKPASG